VGQHFYLPTFETFAGGKTPLVHITRKEYFFLAWCLECRTALLNLWERPGVWFNCTNLRLDVMNGTSGFSRMPDGGSHCCETHLTHSNSK